MKAVRMAFSSALAGSSGLEGKETSLRLYEKHFLIAFLMSVFANHMQLLLLPVKRKLDADPSLTSIARFSSGPMTKSSKRSAYRIYQSYSC